jgi:fructose-specific phosphotransferase system component IIB
MTTDLIKILAMVCISALCGCSKDYQHAEMGKDSPLGKKAAAMIQAMRSAGKDGLAAVVGRDGASGLNQSQQAGLQAALEEIVAADQAELTDMERFGDKVFRATIQTTVGGKSQEFCMLMVLSGDELKWAGKN